MYELFFHQIKEESIDIETIIQNQQDTQSNINNLQKIYYP
jgi:hypothetical protein